MTTTSYRQAFASTFTAGIITAVVTAVVTGCERVAPAATQGGTATLIWTPVTRDAQGNELKNLAGYKVFYGTSPRALFSVVMIPDPQQTRYVVRDLAPGSWYFAVAAYTTSNVEGAHSNVVSKSVP
jgi:hypothetical protein